jgi:hypothetical protein
MNYHTGKLSGRIISASARCIIYDHKREAIYLSSDNRNLIADVAQFQQKRDSGGDYRVYEFAGSEWIEIRT